jgi:(p)ppGpp synthase/HD superfamily hydrolase
VLSLVGIRREIGELVARLPKSRAALIYAERQHAGQRRSADGAPFIVHPIEVGRLLYYSGAPDHVIAAGLLHDVIEKSGVEADELRRRFGARVTALVVAVSEDQSIPKYRLRKAALREQVAAAGDDALMVFAADKLSKARELRLRRPRPGVANAEARTSRSRLRKLTHYQRSAELLEELLPDSPLVKQLRLEVDRIDRTQPASIAVAGAA